MAVENGMYVGKKKEKKKIEIPFADKVYNELLCLTDTLKTEKEFLARICVICEKIMKLRPMYFRQFKTDNDRISYLPSSSDLFDTDLNERMTRYFEYKHNILVELGFYYSDDESMTNDYEIYMKDLACSIAFLNDNLKKYVYILGELLEAIDDIDLEKRVKGLFELNDTELVMISSMYSYVSIFEIIREFTSYFQFVDKDEPENYVQDAYGILDKELMNQKLEECETILEMTVDEIPYLREKLDDYISSNL